MKKLLILFTILTLIGNVPTWGQDDTKDLIDLSLEELMQLNLSVGSKTIKNPDQIPGAVTIVDKTLINQMRARTLRDVLNVMIPGMDVVPTYFEYGNPVSEGIYSRGILSDFNQQILILFNGENKFNETTFGSPYTGMEFTLENVERIEINNSPAPLLGGGALVTINIVTKEQNLSGTEVYLNSGFNEDDGLQSKRFTLNYGKYVDTWHIGTSLQYSDDLGQVHPEAGSFGLGQSETSLRDGIQGAVNFNLNIKSPNEKFELGTWYKNIRKDAYFSNLEVSQSVDLYEYKTSTFHNYLKYNVNGNIDLSAGLSYFNHLNSFNLDRPIPVGVNQNINLPFQNSLKNFNLYLKGGYLKEFELLGSQTLYAGFKVEREGQSDHAQYQLDVVTNNFVDVTEQNRANFGVDLADESRTISSVFAENNWNLNQEFSILYGFRFENYENFGGNQIQAFNPRLALAYLPSDRWIVRAQYSTAVRPPSNYEISGNNFIPQLYGNRNLTFEKLTTLELSVKYKNSGFEINVNPFVEIFEDQIRYVASPVDLTARVATNSGETDVVGVEVTSKYAWGSGNYVFLNGSKFSSQDKLSDVETPFIPDLYINGGLNLALGNANVNWTFFYRGDRSLPEDLVINTSVGGGSQFMSNLALSYQLATGLDAYILAENLLNTSVFIPLSQDGLNVPLRGRVINVGLNLNF